MVKKKYLNKMCSWNKKLYLLIFMLCFFVFFLQPSSVSTGKIKKNNIKIPVLKGKSIIMAKRQLKALGFRNIVIKYQKTKNRSLDGKIKNTFPPIGKRLSLKKRIILNVYSAKTTIPDVYGLTLGQAGHIIRNAGLQSILRYIQANNAGQRDRIRDTKPPRGNLVRPNSQVALYVYLTHIMPDVYGMEMGPAVRRLADVGLSCILSYVPSNNNNQRGRVRDTNPPREAQPINRYPKIYIYLAAAVPDVYGMEMGAAVSRLIDTGFRSIVNYVPSNNSSQRGKVRDTVPARGEQPSGNYITLKIYLASSVPDVYGMSKTDAVRRLSDDGLMPVISYVNTANQSLNDKVKDTVPPRGAQPIGQQVRLYIYRYN